MNVSYKLKTLLCVMFTLFSYSAIMYADLFDDFDITDDEPHKIDVLYDDDVFDDSCFLHEAIPLKGLDAALLVGLLNDLQLIPILQEDFFLKTSPLAKRSILDSTLVERIPYRVKKPWTVGGFSFINITDKYNFTESSVRLCSYLALSSPTLAEKLDGSLENVSLVTGDALNTINVRRILNLAGNLRIEERNIGILFYLIRQWENIQLRIHTPLYYHERNFFLTDDEINQIGDEFGVVDQDDDFRKEHAISDRLGFGDTRIEASFLVSEKPTVTCHSGLQVTLPTAFTIAKEWNGSTFKKPDTYPEVPFDELRCILESAINQNLSRVERNRAQEIIQEFILGSTDRIAANLLDDELGNKKHFGIGGFVYTDMPLTQFSHRQWAHESSWINRLSLEYLLPKTEKRFYINKNSPESFENRNFEDDTMAEENLHFLEQEFVNRLYLLALNTKIQPHLIFRWTSMFSHTAGPCSCYAGTNFWVQSQENLKTIDAPLEVTSQLDKRKTYAPAAYQLKLLAGANVSFEEADRTWTIGIDADYTALKQGVGRDFTLALRLDASF